MVTLHRLTGFIGAQISGLDLSRPLAPDAALGLRDGLRAHHVLVIRGQGLTIAAQKRLTAAFGAPMRLPYVAPLDDDDEVIAVLKEAQETDTGVFGGDWHADFSFLENPPAGSVLNAVDVPAVGGDTVWSSQVAAYESLPARLRRLVDGRRAVHVGKPYGVRYAPPAARRANAAMRMTRGDAAADREVFHPAVVTDPVSGRRALFLNPVYTTRLDGMSEAESAPVLRDIYAHATRPDIAMRHRWRAGDVVVWDNRATLHYATNDYDGCRRLLLRTTFGGEPPR